MKKQGDGKIREDRVIWGCHQERWRGRPTKVLELQWIKGMFEIVSDWQLLGDVIGVINNKIVWWHELQKNGSAWRRKNVLKLEKHLQHPFCCCSAAQSCWTLCDRMDCSTQVFPVLHQLLELAETHVHWVSDAIQPSRPLSSPSPPAFSLSQHQGLFKWVSSSHQVAKVLEL